MTVKKSPALGIAAAVLLAAVSAFADDAPVSVPMPKEFEVVIARPMAQGDVFEIDEKISVTRILTKAVAGEPTAEGKDPRSMELTGTLVVAAVDATGTPAEFTVKVKNLSGLGGDDEQRRQYVPEGTEIIIKRTTKDTVFSVPESAMGDAVRKVELSKEAQLALTMLYPKLNASSITDDQVYPSKGPRKAGEIWDADVKAVADQAAGDDVKIDPHQTIGSASLRSARRSETGINLTIETKIEAAIVSLGNMPPGTKLSNSSMKATNVLIIPSDPKAKSSKQELSETLDLRTSGLDNKGRAMTISQTIQIQHSQTLTFVKNVK